MRTPLVGLSLVMLAGCGSSSPNSSVSVDNMNPVGTVSGTIVDAATEMPITGATVSILSGGTSLTAMTDAMGQYTVAKVPAGTFFMTVTQKGYQTALVDDQLDGAVGNFPVSNPTHTERQIGLVANAGSFAVQLVDDSGNPVPMVKLSAKTNVRELFYDNGFPAAQGSYQVTATTDMNGNATFAGLPSYGSLTGLVDDTLTVTVPPIQTMGGQYTFLGLTVAYHVNALTSLIQTINVVGPSAPLAVIDSNVDYIKGKQGSNPPASTPFTSPVGSQVAVGGPITISFNQAIQASTLQAVLLDKNGATVAVTMMPTVSLNLLSLVPSAKLTAGQRYNLVLHAVAAAQAGPGSGHAQAELDITAPIFTAPAAGSTVSVTSAHLVTGTSFQFVQVTFSEPIGIGLGAAAGYAIDCAAFFEPPSTMSGGFNNDPSTVFQGDWKSTPMSSPPQNLVCRQPTGAMGEPYMNVTQLQSLETANAGATVLTGFSDTWQIPVDLAMPPMNNESGPCLFGTACAKVSTLHKVHFIFSRQTGPGVKRTDGTPVPDNIVSGIM